MKKRTLLVYSGVMAPHIAPPSVMLPVMAGSGYRSGRTNEHNIAEYKRFHQIAADNGECSNQSIPDHMNRPIAHLLPVLMITLSGLITSGCSPTVRVEASDKPITINMNIRIDHEIRVKVDKEIDKLVEKRSDIF